MRKKLERKRVSQKRWLAEKYLRDNRCHYCGASTYLFEGGLQATVDHKVPQSVRRWNHWTNYALACRTCNQEKGSLDYHTFREWKSAQGMAARSGETGTGSTEGNSQVAESDAPTPPDNHHA